MSINRCIIHIINMHIMILTKTYIYIAYCLISVAGVDTYVRTLLCCSGVADTITSCKQQMSILKNKIVANDYVH